MNYLFINILRLFDYDYQQGVGNSQPHAYNVNFMTPSASHH